MNPITESLLYNLDVWLNRRLDQLHDDLIAKFRTLARSTGQRTRVRP